METGRPAWVEVDLAAIQHNVRAIQSHTHSRCSVLAVVKANAYGHGLVEVARASLRAGAFGVATALVSEARALRDAGVEAPILVLGTPLASEAEEYVAYEIAASIGDYDLARAFSEAARRQGKTAHVHLKVDTGMGRCGVRAEDAPDLLRRILSLPALSVEAASTHFSTADAPDLDYAQEQVAAFHTCLQRMRASGIRPPRAHAANSAAILRLPEVHHDFVRPGLLLYGIPPYPGAETVLGVRPALSLKARIVSVKSLRQGECVGYGLAYRMARDGRIAIVPLGYADGFSRRNSNNGEVLLRGRRVPIRGRICMDQFMIEVTDVPEAQVGDEVVLLGQQGSETITAAEIAGRTETIEHEVLAALASRLPRIYRNEEEGAR
ncbi:MAG TPA: alanine racemase [Armatimonadota bacterium]|jgi:alanine racemase|nr:alanine racemase [Armatimonadota bacterium]HOM82344.1 alanine racemase [Armatimonadota bacterium]HPO72022.1 alanine racemase [Armatimonadota bacterium]HPT97643.1 alanine racemase [Armatimonadota bacterium]